MIRLPISRAASIGLGVASVLLLLLAYTWLSQRQHRLNPSDTTIPTWRQLGHGVVQAFEVNDRSQDRWVVADARATGLRLFAGLGFGVLGAVILGMAMGCFTPVEAFAYPLLSLLAKVPPTAALAVFFVLVGTDMNMYVAMIAFGILPTLAMTVFLAVKEFPEELQYKAYTLGASNMEVILSIMFRYALPRLLDSVRLMIGPAMVFLIAAEMLVGDVGFGYRIRLQSKLVNMSVVYPYLAMLAGFGYAMDFALKALQRWLCPWSFTKT
ncbi:MAG: ABC transporter permease subunit [Verrucomicrobia bacterium]|nr:ABC transporter permease subunit [Verrucomicrobiota bacterium]